MKTEKSTSFAVVHGGEIPIDKVVSSVRSFMSPAKLPKHRVMITTSKGTSSLSVIIWNGITVESGFDTRSVFEGIKKSVKGAEVISVSSKMDKESAVRKALIYGSGFAGIFYLTKEAIEARIPYICANALQSSC